MKLQIVLIIVSFTLLIGEAEAQTNCEVTYIANEGFLVQCGNYRIMFDALFGGINGDWCEEPGDSIINLMMSGTQPFGRIDYVIITHRHIDHFKDSIALDFLKSNTESILICPSQVNDILKNRGDYETVSDRIKIVSSEDTLLNGDGISIRAIRMKHGIYYETDSLTGKAVDRHRNTDNYIYQVTAGGFSLFHSGDCSTGEIQRFKELFPEGGAINIGFFNRTFFGKEGLEILNFLKPDNVVIMHIETEKIDYYKSVFMETPGVTVFSRKLETKTFTEPHY